MQSTSKVDRAIAKVGAILFFTAAAGIAAFLIAVSLLSGGEAVGSTVVPTVDSTCLQSKAPSVVSGTVLDGFTPTKSGVTYAAADAALELVKQQGKFSQTTLGIATADVKVGCSADFDGDGWVDFVATSDDALSYIRFYKNRTYENPEPNWSDPTQIRTPKFVAGPNLVAVNNPSVSDLGCGDFNGDGKADFFVVRCTTSTCNDDGTPSITDMYLGNGDGTFQAKYSFLSTPSSLKAINWWGTSASATVDWNGDGKLDMVWALAKGTSDATVVVMLNDGSAKPKFDTRITILGAGGALGFSAKVPGLAIADVDGDGNKDLVIGSPDTSILRYYPGTAGGGFGALQSIASGFSGSANSIFLADLSGDGKADLLVATDGHYDHPGGLIDYWQNNGTTSPFSSGIVYTNQTSATDFDLGWTFDYDHDPDHTIDFVAADGNDSAKYFLFANRTLSTYVTCGTAASGTLDIGALAATEMTVTAVRLAPVGSGASSSDGTMSYEASIDGGVTWHAAPACADDPTQFCATFDTSVGNQIRWRATMCSNSNHTRTPHLTSMGTSFTYVAAANHFRSGPVARDGVIYVGAFRAPGEAGHLFAIDDATGATRWDAATLLDSAAVSSRNVYTTTAVQNPLVCEDPLKLSLCRLDFKDATLNDLLNGPLMLVALVTPTVASAKSIIDWWTSARFGLTQFHVMGGVVGSTPAVLSHPARPSWYSLATSAEQAAISAFDDLYANRPQLVFVGGEDGAMHAFFTNPVDPSDPLNGKEAWAFVPADVAARLGADQASGKVTAFSDGSPTLVNAKILGKWRTILISGEGNGGHSVYALDVTDTITVNATAHTLSTAGKGPIPLWQFTDVNMGRTLSKPTVARTKILGIERWLAVFSSGSGGTGSADVGDTVYAIDLDTGLMLWRFDLGDTNTYVSTDITGVDGVVDPGTTLDGYIDRLFFADNKGRIWKVDPANFVGNLLTTVNSLVNVGLGPKALFATKVTSGALGVERAIGGTIAVAQDATGRFVLYFGTGGTEDSPAGVQNAFYAVYADTGAIRSKLDGSNGIAVGTKFYGGVLEQDGQVIFTDGTDVSGAGLCSSSAGQIVALDANTFAAQFSTAASSKIVAPVYAVDGEVYAVTLSGQVTTSAYTGVVSSSSGGTVAGGGSSGTTGVSGSTTAPFTALNWRQIN